jgi:Rrf2 family transcriptional regulator, iron-sulfur cluster assembly transcription factor
MIYSSACEYAIRALTHLAENPGERLKLKDIAEAEGVPAPFLSNVFQGLVAADILDSSRGPTGGYALARSPEGIRLLDIRKVVDGLGDLEGCVVGLAQCGDQMPCPLHRDWAPVRERIRTFLTETTLASMAEARRSKPRS